MLRYIKYKNQLDVLYKRIKAKPHRSTESAADLLQTLIDTYKVLEQEFEILQEQEDLYTPEVQEVKRSAEKLFIEASTWLEATSAATMSNFQAKELADVEQLTVEGCDGHRLNKFVKGIEYHHNRLNEAGKIDLVKYIQAMKIDSDELPIYESWVDLKGKLVSLVGGEESVSTLLGKLIISKQENATPLEFAKKLQSIAAKISKAQINEGNIINVQAKLNITDTNEKMALVSLYKGIDQRYSAIIQAGKPATMQEAITAIGTIVVPDKEERPEVFYYGRGNNSGPRQGQRGRGNRRPRGNFGPNNTGPLTNREEIVCYNCRGVGHLQRDCPSRRRENRGRGSNHPRGRGGRTTGNDSGNGSRTSVYFAENEESEHPTGNGPNLAGEQQGQA